MDVNQPISTRTTSPFWNGAEVLCEGFDSQAQMRFGRSYAESPDIDGRIWFDANREVEPGTPL